jgi:hypothetical protein
VNLSSPGQPRKLCPLDAAYSPAISDHESCIPFAANHFSRSDRSQPPEMCFGGNSPFLHHRKSVERLTPTTRTTSLVLIRASMPTNRSMMGSRFGLAAGAIFGLLTGGTTSTSGSCMGRSPPTAFRRLEILILGRWRRKTRGISRGPETVLPAPLETATVPGDGMDVLIALPPTVAPVLLPDRRITLHDRAAYP